MALTKRITSATSEVSSKSKIEVPTEYTKEKLLKELKQIYKEKNEHLSASVDLKKFTIEALYTHLQNMKKKPVFDSKKWSNY